MKESDDGCCIPCSTASSCLDCQNLGALSFHQMLATKFRVHSIEEEKGAVFIPCNMRRASFYPYIPLHAPIPHSYFRVPSSEILRTPLPQIFMLVILRYSSSIAFRGVYNLPSYVSKTMSKVISTRNILFTQKNCKSLSLYLNFLITNQQYSFLYYFSIALLRWLIIIVN